jgi:hypothetical protein
MEILFLLQREFGRNVMSLSFKGSDGYAASGSQPKRIVRYGAALWPAK